MGEINLKEYLTQVRTIENDIHLMNRFEKYCYKLENDPRVTQIHKDLEDCKYLKERKYFDWRARDYKFIQNYYDVHGNNAYDSTYFAIKFSNAFTKITNQHIHYPDLDSKDYFKTLVYSAIIPALLIILFHTEWISLIAIIIGAVTFLKIKSSLYWSNHDRVIYETIADYAITILNNELEEINKNNTTQLNKLNALRIPLDIAKKRLEELYNNNVVFPKYRNFIAVNQISEYIDSGRCTELEGTNGAYNLFENELRQNIIIDKLDTVINQLDQIRQNQYYIYQALRATQNAIENMDISVVTNTYIDGVKY